MADALRIRPERFSFDHLFYKNIQRQSTATSFIQAASVPAGELADMADSQGVVRGWLWLCWEAQGGARITMGPPPERGAASEEYPFGQQLTGNAPDLIDLQPLERPHVSLSKQSVRSLAPSSHAYSVPS